MRELFAPGFAVDPLDDLRWAMVHGQPKRLRVVASLLMEIGWAQQRIALTVGSAGAPLRLTPDVAVSLLDAGGNRCSVCLAREPVRRASRLERCVADGNRHTEELRRRTFSALG
jgi:hypothetical protein